MQYDVKITYHVRVVKRTKRAAVETALGFNYEALETSDQNHPAANFEIHATKVRK